MSPSTPHRRFEADREDLMRDATALRQRAELRVSGEPEHVVAGYRSDGSLSLYFGPDPCFHFDPVGRLRRAVVGGEPYRTQGNTLARLRRVRSTDFVELHRHDLSAAELDAFLGTVHTRLQSFVDALRSGRFACLREIPEHGRLTDRLIDDLSRMAACPIALAPAIKGKR